LSKYLKIDGFQCICGSYLILDFNLKIGGNESIGAIKEILTVDGYYVFYLELYSIKNQDLHYNCLEISSENKIRFMKYEDWRFKQAHFAKYISDRFLLQIRYLHHLIIPIE
jgi:hypothetical protein